MHFIDPLRIAETPISIITIIIIIITFIFHAKCFLGPLKFLIILRIIPCDKILHWISFYTNFSKSKSNLQTLSDINYKMIS